MRNVFENVGNHGVPGDIFVHRLDLSIHTTVQKMSDCPLFFGE